MAFTPGGGYISGDGAVPGVGYVNIDEVVASVLEVGAILIPATKAINYASPQAKGLELVYDFSESAGSVVNSKINKKLPVALSNSPNFIRDNSGNTALSTNGTNHFGTISSLSLEHTDKLSISLWFRTTATAQQILLEHSINTNNNNAFFVSINSARANSIGFTDHQNIVGNNVVYCSASINDGKWHHALITTDRALPALSQNLIYIDGRLDTILDVIYRADLSGNYGSYPAYLMSRAGTSYYTKAGISDLRIYSRVLTSYEALDLYINPNGLYQKSRTIPFSSTAAPPVTTNSNFFSFF